MIYDLNLRRRSVDRSLCDPFLKFWERTGSLTISQTSLDLILDSLLQQGLISFPVLPPSLRWAFWLPPGAEGGALGHHWELSSSNLGGGGGCWGPLAGALDLD